MKNKRLYNKIHTINHYKKEELYTLNIFITHILFCFFMKNTRIFPQLQQIIKTLENDLDTMFFLNLFDILDLLENSPE